MIRVPFSFSLTGGSTKYGTPFENADAAFTNALSTLWQIGTRETLKRYLAGTL